MKKIKGALMLTFTVLMCVSSCSNKQQTQPKPADLIPEEKIVSILADIYLLESTVYFLPADSTRIQIAREMYDNLLVEYDISLEQLNSSIYYYLGYKELSDYILQKASEKLQTDKSDWFSTDTFPG